MAERYQLTLSDEQRRDLEKARDHALRPYLRERAAGLLKIADGMSIKQVAEKGLLKRHSRNTVKGWIERFLAAGTAGLWVRKGRGRKPAFSPSLPDAESARQALLNIVRRSPACFHYRRSRWTLELLLKHCGWLRLHSLPGLSYLLKRLRIVLKRARDYVHSPDPDYTAKVAYVARFLLRAWFAPERYVLVYFDEGHYERQPTLARAYESRGREQPRGRRSHRCNTIERMAAGLNALTGKVSWKQGSKIGRKQLIALYREIRKQYPEAEEIYLVVDNWPVHFHPDVLAQLAPQQWPWTFRLPGNWPAFHEEERVADPLPIQLLPLPTYASWLNPVEKLWRKLKQEHIHLHQHSDDWEGLKKEVAAFLDTFANGSPELLRYVGLLPEQEHAQLIC